MSGGSMDYVGWKVEDQAANMGDPELIDLVRDMGILMHDREWFLSGDTDEEDWLESVRKFKAKWFDKPRVDRLKEYVDKIFADAKKACMEIVCAAEGEKNE